jgi:hypothetical protein
VVDVPSIHEIKDLYFSSYIAPDQKGWRSPRVVGERYRSQVAEARLEGRESTPRGLIFGQGVDMAISVPELSQRSDDGSFRTQSSDGYDPTATFGERVGGSSPRAFPSGPECSHEVDPRNQGMHADPVQR